MVKCGGADILSEAKDYVLSRTANNPKSVVWRNRSTSRVDTLFDFCKSRNWTVADLIKHTYKAERYFSVSWAAILIQVV